MSFYLPTRYRLLVALAQLCALQLAACKGASSPQPPTENRAEPPPAASSPESAVVRAADTQTFYEAPAQVQLPPSASAEIAPPYRAQILELHVRPGQEVAADAPIVTVLMPEVTQAAGSYLGAALRMQAYEQRRQQLLSLKADGLMRLADLSEAEARFAEARATQLEARAILQAAGWKLAEPAQLAAQLEARAGRITLRSPIRGTVLSVHGTLGQRWEPGAPPIARLVSAGVGSEAELRVEARLLAGLPSGVRYFFRTPSGLQLPLRLLTSAPVVDSRDGTITSWFAFAAPPAAGSIASGLTGKVYVEPEERPAGSPLPEKDEQIVAVPTRAVRWQRNQPEVQRVAKSKAEPPQSIPVRVIMNLGTELLIAAALRPGEEVLLQPGRELPAGEQQ